MESYLRNSVNAKLTNIQAQIAVRHYTHLANPFALINF